jgi:transposase-like protein
MSGTKGMTHYDLEIKLQADHLHEQEGMSYIRVAEQLGIRKAEQIEKWYQANRYMRPLTCEERQRYLVESLYDQISP